MQEPKEIKKGKPETKVYDCGQKKKQGRQKINKGGGKRVIRY